ncbi:hypothetical protein CL653_02540 [bacterium]|nr:hypothetical protein [bacterium]|tara:strand:- start:580 stop:1038 length:459 start_codon:yes stop_codon:yes gene_type:complete
MEVKDIMKPAVVVGEEASFRESLAKMISDKTNTLLVVNNDGELSGEICVSDLLDAIVPEYLDGDNIAANFATEEMFEEAVRDTEEKQVSYFMSTDISPVKLHDGLMAVAATAIANQKARIPVVDDNNHPIGVISRQGLKHIIAKFLGISESK